MASNIMTLAGWYFLPNLVTGYVQSALYAIFIRAGDPKPPPGSPRFVRDRRHIQILVVVAYLLYTIYEADYQLLQAPDFYSILGVPHDVDSRGLQSRFRRLTVQFHPDKATGSDKAAIEAVYVQLKLARDVLIDQNKRFAYDRFGPDILAWQNSKTLRDFVFAGLQNTAVFYVGSASVLVLLSITGHLQAGRYWRYLVIALLCTMEMYIVTRPEFPWILTNVLNPILKTTGVRLPYLPYQMIILLRKLTLTFFIALSQLGPLLQDPQERALAQAGPTLTGQDFDRVDALAQATDQEVSRLMGMELVPFSSERSAAAQLRTGLKEWLVQNTIRNDPDVKAAAARVLDRRRTAEAGQPARM